MSIKSPPIGGWSMPSALGWIAVNPLQNNGQLAYSYQSAKIIDVQRWQYRVRYNEKRLSMSGLLGCPTSRRSAAMYDYRLEMLWDPTNPPEVLLRPRMGFSLYLLLGAQPNITIDGKAALTGGETTYDSANLPPKQWFTPLACAEEITPILDAKGKKLIGQTVVGSAHTHSFLLPDDSDQMTAYINYLNSTYTRLMR